MPFVVLMFMVACGFLAIIALREACIMGMDGKEMKGWKGIGRMLLNLATVFSCTLSATNVARWSFALGGCLVCIPLGLWIRRCRREHCANVRLINHISGLCPHKSWNDANTFEEKLSVAVNRYEGFDMSLIPQLPFDLLQRVHRTYLTENRYLTMDDFKKECLWSITIITESVLGKAAALLLFVEPSELSRCQKWYERCALMMKLYEESTGAKLANVVRCMWKSDIINGGTRRDCTWFALCRLNSALEAELRRHLWKEFAGDSWIASRLAPNTSDTTATMDNCNSTLMPIEQVALSVWYTADDFEECRMCKVRPSNRSPLVRKIRKISSTIFKYTFSCDICHHQSMNLNCVPRIKHIDV